jgi:carbon storage regulator
VQHHAEENEKVLIGKEITIVVAEIRGGQIRLGIQAPADLLILREKLLGASQVDLPPPSFFKSVVYPRLQKKYFYRANL